MEKQRRSTGRQSTMGSEVSPSFRKQLEAVAEMREKRLMSNRLLKDESSLQTRTATDEEAEAAKNALLPLPEHKKRLTVDVSTNYSSMVELFSGSGSLIPDLHKEVMIPFELFEAVQNRQRYYKDEYVKVEAELRETKKTLSSTRTDLDYSNERVKNLTQTNLQLNSRVEQLTTFTREMGVKRDAAERALERSKDEITRLTELLSRKEYELSRLAAECEDVKQQLAAKEEVATALKHQADSQKDANEKLNARMFLVMRRSFRDGKTPAGSPTDAALPSFSAARKGAQKSALHEISLGIPTVEESGVDHVALQEEHEAEIALLEDAAKKEHLAQERVAAGLRNQIRVLESDLMVAHDQASWELNSRLSWAQASRDAAIVQVAKLETDKVNPQLDSIQSLIGPNPFTASTPSSVFSPLYDSFSDCAVDTEKALLQVLRTFDRFESTLTDSLSIKDLRDRWRGFSSKWKSNCETSVKEALMHLASVVRSIPALSDGYRRSVESSAEQRYYKPDILTFTQETQTEQVAEEKKPAPKTSVAVGSQTVLPTWASDATSPLINQPPPSKTNSSEALTGFKSAPTLMSASNVATSDRSKDLAASLKPPPSQGDETKPEDGASKRKRLGSKVSVGLGRGREGGISTGSLSMFHSSEQLQKLERQPKESESSGGAEALAPAGSSAKGVKSPTSPSQPSVSPASKKGSGVSVQRTSKSSMFSEDVSVAHDESGLASSVSKVRSSDNMRPTRRTRSESKKHGSETKRNVVETDPDDADHKQGEEAEGPSSTSEVRHMSRQGSRPTISRDKQRDRVAVAIEPVSPSQRVSAAKPEKSPQQQAVVPPKSQLAGGSSANNLLPVTEELFTSFDEPEPDDEHELAADVHADPAPRESHYEDTVHLRVNANSRSSGVTRRRRSLSKPKSDRESHQTPSMLTPSAPPLAPPPGVHRRHSQVSQLSMTPDVTSHADSDDQLRSPPQPPEPIIQVQVQHVIPEWVSRLLIPPERLSKEQGLLYSIMPERYFNFHAKFVRFVQEARRKLKVSFPIADSAQYLLSSVEERSVADVHCVMRFDEEILDALLSAMDPVLLAAGKGSNSIAASKQLMQYKANMDQLRLHALDMKTGADLKGLDMMQREELRAYRATKGEAERLLANSLPPSLAQGYLQDLQSKSGQDGHTEGEITKPSSAAAANSYYNHPLSISPQLRVAAPQRPALSVTPSTMDLQLGHQRRSPMPPLSLMEFPVMDDRLTGQLLPAIKHRDSQDGSIRSMGHGAHSAAASHHEPTPQPAALLPLKPPSHFPGRNPDKANHPDQAPPGSNQHASLIHQLLQGRSPATKHLNPNPTGLEHQLAAPRNTEIGPMQSGTKPLLPGLHLLPSATDQSSRGKASAPFNPFQIQTLQRGGPREHAVGGTQPVGYSSRRTGKPSPPKYGRPAPLTAR